jgi:hypothetical protein
MYTAALTGAFVLLAAGMLADTLTTLRGYYRGELNPIMAALMVRFGPLPALAATKAIVAALCAAAALLLPGDWYVVAGILIVALLHIAAAVLNEAR